MDNLEKETWKDIPNYEGIYQASNLGKIKSLERIDALGHRLKEKILKPGITHKGYYRVALCKNSIRKFFYVHRLVWEAFNGTIPEGLQVNHISERKSENRLSNLNLMTPKENSNWGTRIERQVKKRINGKCSKTVLQFTLDNILVKEFPSIRQAERETGFSHQNIVNCCKGRYEQAYGYKWQYKENKKGEN